MKKFNKINTLQKSIFGDKLTKSTPEMVQAFKNDVDKFEASVKNNPNVTPQVMADDYVKLARGMGAHINFLSYDEINNIRHKIQSSIKSFFENEEIPVAKKIDVNSLIDKEPAKSNLTPNNFLENRTILSPRDIKDVLDGKITHEDVPKLPIFEQIPQMVKKGKLTSSEAASMLKQAADSRSVRYSSRGILSAAGNLPASDANEVYKSLISDPNNHEARAKIAEHEHTTPENLDAIFEMEKNNPYSTNTQDNASLHPNASDKIREHTVQRHEADAKTPEVSKQMAYLGLHSHFNEHHVDRLIDAALSSPNQKKANKIMEMIAKNENINLTEPQQHKIINHLFSIVKNDPDSVDHVKRALNRPEVSDSTIHTADSLVGQLSGDSHSLISSHGIQEIQGHINNAKKQHGHIEDPESVHIVHGTEKLRKIRDFIEEKGGSMPKKELEKMGINSQLFSSKGLIDAKGMVHAQGIQNWIDAQPKTKYGITHTEYGDEDSSTGPHEHDIDAHHEKIEEQIRQDALDSFDPNEYIDIDPSAYEDEEGNLDEDAYQDSRDNAINEAYANFEVEYPSRSDRESKMYSSAKDGQRHNHQRSAVLQINASPEHIKKMKESGVFGIYRDFLDKFAGGSHPTAKHNGIGWVRYTGSTNGDGLHIDEMQTDIGQDLAKKIAEQSGSESVGNKYAKKYPPEKMAKLYNILFDGKHHSEVFYNAFLQHARDTDKIGQTAAIWTPEPKGGIANQRIHIGVNKDDISRFHNDPHNVTHEQHAIARWYSKNKLKISGFSPEEHYTAKKQGKTLPIDPAVDEVDKQAALKVWNDHVMNHPQNTKKDPAFETKLPIPLPVNMTETYGKTPEKAGAEPSQYGELATQNSPYHKGKPTQSIKIRKSIDLGMFKDELKKDFLSRYKEHIKKIGQAVLGGGFSSKPESFTWGSKHAIGTKKKRKIWGTGSKGSILTRSKNLKKRLEALEKAFEEEGE